MDLFFLILCQTDHCLQALVEKLTIRYLFHFSHLCFIKTLTTAFNVTDAGITSTGRFQSCYSLGVPTMWLKSGRCITDWRRPRGDWIKRSKDRTAGDSTGT